MSKKCINFYTFDPKITQKVSQMVKKVLSIGKINLFISFLIIIFVGKGPGNVARIKNQ